MNLKILDWVRSKASARKWRRRPWKHPIYIPLGRGEFSIGICTYEGKPAITLMPLREKRETGLPITDADVIRERMVVLAFDTDAMGQLVRDTIELALLQPRTFAVHLHKTDDMQWQPVTKGPEA